MKIFSTPAVQPHLLLHIHLPALYPAFVCSLYSSIRLLHTLLSVLNPHFSTYLKATPTTPSPTRLSYSSVLPAVFYCLLTLQTLFNHQSPPSITTYIQTNPHHDLN